MPPNAEQHCQYAEDWAVVKEWFALKVSVQERDAIVAIKTDCSYLYLQTKKMRSDHRAVCLLDGLLTRFTD
jgi:hypothetical protein